MPDLAAWAVVDALTVDQAACLWAGEDPAEGDLLERKVWGKTAELVRIAPVKQMLSAAIRSGELPADTSANIMASIGDHSKTLVTREALRAFAKSKKQHPAFLFDTLLPEKTETGGDNSKEADRQPSRIGRPVEYDWDGFVIEIIRIANTLDGLPEKQSELIVTMLQWCEDTWGNQPAQSTTKDKISKIYNGIGLGRKGQNLLGG